MSETMERSVLERKEREYQSLKDQIALLRKEVAAQSGPRP